MRIACVQFAPQVGDIDNNLNRADSVLAKANPDDLEDLDLLVLPELAFTGYNFKSLNQISPFLEPQGSGISALWARTTALKYNTNVVVGYPERVDVAPKWPTGPEYYNSTIVVNGDGETVANYRKSFLYVIDETWALEGRDGFFVEEIPELGTIAMGICMDLNPYRFEAPWHAFEFAFHILSVEANLVIVTMAWVTREDGRHFSRMPEEPDMETLTYWVQRLEPLIRIDGHEEVIVVFCNRTGIEDDLVYAGTSAVIGIQDGEVNVYGILGRSVKDVLVVDTDNGPFAKLIQRPEDNGKDSTHILGGRRNPRPRAESAASRTPDEPAKVRIASEEQQWPSPKPALTSRPKRTKPESPRVTIPEVQFATHNLLIDESPGVATPTCPSPTPLDQRPVLTSPRPRPSAHHVDTPYPRDEPDPRMGSPHIYGGRVSVDSPVSRTGSPSSGLVPDKYFRLKSQPPLRSPMESRFPNVYPPASSAVSSPKAGSLVSVHSKTSKVSKASKTSSGKWSNTGNTGSKRQSPRPDASQRKRPENSAQQNEKADSNSKDSQSEEIQPPRPSSPKSRNASRTGRTTYERQPSESHQPNLSQVGQRLESLSRRPGSAMDSGGNDSEGSRHGRSRARQASISRPLDSPRPRDENFGNVSSKESPFIASPTAMGEATVRSQSDLFKNREQNLSRNAAARFGAGQSVGPWAGDRPHSRNENASFAQRKANIEPDETRTLVWGELSKMVGEVLSHPREATRDRRQNSIPPVPPPMPEARKAPRSRSSDPPADPSQSGKRLISPNRQDSTDQRPMRTIMAADSANASLDPDDEIVAEIIFHSHAQNQKNVQGQASNPASPEMVQKGGARQEQSPNLRERSQNSPHASGKVPLPPGSRERKQATPRGPFGEIRVYKEPIPLNLKERPDSGGSCPTLDGASIHTITTPVRSPVTPSPRYFEPKTPKAMKLDSEFGLPSSFSDVLSSEEFPPLATIESHLKGSRGSGKAKSTGW